MSGVGPNNAQEEIVKRQVDEIEYEYRILKEDEEKEEKRKILMLLILFFLILSVTLGGAFFSYSSYKNAVSRNVSDKILEPIKKDTLEDLPSVPDDFDVDEYYSGTGSYGGGSSSGSGGSGGSSGGGTESYKPSHAMEILFISGAEFVAQDIEPGWESVTAKEFRIKNTGVLPANYNINFINVETNFNRLEDLRYTVEANDKVVIDKAVLPSKDSIILPEEVIEVGETITYKIYFEYVETNTDQSDDANKTYKMLIDVTSGVPKFDDEVEEDE